MKACIVFHLFIEQEYVEVPMLVHQVLPLTGYIFEASYSTLATQANKFRVWTNQNS